MVRHSLNRSHGAYSAGTQGYIVKELPNKRVEFRPYNPAKDQNKRVVFETIEIPREYLTKRRKRS